MTEETSQSSLSTWWQFISIVYDARSALVTMNRHAYFILAFVCYFSNLIIHVYCDEISSQATVSKIDFPKRKWLSELFAQAERDFDMNISPVSDQCREDFRVYKLHLANQSAWAVRSKSHSSHLLHLNGRNVPKFGPLSEQFFCLCARN